MAETMVDQKVVLWVGQKAAWMEVKKAVQLGSGKDERLAASKVSWWAVKMAASKALNLAVQREPSRAAMKVASLDQTKAENWVASMVGKWVAQKEPLVKAWVAPLD